MTLHHFGFPFEIVPLGARLFDKLFGEVQAVIKSLGKIFKDVNGVSGSTILGDGTVALIMDAPSPELSGDAMRDLLAEVGQLLEAARVRLPEALPCRGVIVSTKKSLAKSKSKA